jgi:glycosyltransferase involved in cell wall biosynthesis
VNTTCPFTRADPKLPHMASSMMSTKNKKYTRRIRLRAVVVLVIVALGSISLMRKVEKIEKIPEPPLLLPLPTISVCIPAMAQDLFVENGQRFAKVLLSILKQTYPPLEVILGLSEASDSEANMFQGHFQWYLGNIPLRFSSTPSKGSVGMNRNRAASLSRSKLVSFFDADNDLMHPQRLEIIAQTFHKFESKVVLHSFSEELEPELLHEIHVLLSKDFCELNAARHDENLAQIEANPLADRRQWILASMHHGHLTVDRELIQERKFEEDFNGKEDSIYVNSVVEMRNCVSARNGVFINAPLTYNYLPRSKQTASHSSDTASNSSQNLSDGSGILTQGRYRTVRF